MRKYPEPSDYQTAIQNPALVFAEPALRACRVRLNQLDMPVVSSGGFALSFYLQSPVGEQWVVRCFKTDSPARRARYAAISDFLNAHPDPLLLDVDYYEQGIRVGGAWEICAGSRTGRAHWTRGRRPGRRPASSVAPS